MVLWYKLQAVKCKVKLGMQVCAVGETTRSRAMLILGIHSYGVSQTIH